MTMENILQEAYFSKEDIKPLQDQLSKIRKKFYGKPYNLSMNVDKDVLKFNRMVEKFFGYDTYSLNIAADQTLNAYAWPIGVFSNPEQKKKMIQSLKAAKDGFRHDPKMGQISAIVTLNLGLINAVNITDEEIFAILLHEVGHTFFEAVMDKDCKFTIASRLLNALRKINEKIMSRISSGEEITDKQIDSDIDQHSSIFEKVKNLKNIFKPESFLNVIRKFKSSNIGKKFFKESLEDNMRSERLSYTNEKFADTFAAMYGYGVHLHTALMKMTDYAYKELNIHQSTNSIYTAYKVADYMLWDALAYVLNIKDEHPDGLARIKTTVDYLKKELSKDSLDPKMKMQLVAQLDELNKLIDDYINFPKDEDNISIIRAYYTKLYEKFGGDRREQDTDNNSIFDTIDKRYSDLQNK